MCGVILLFPIRLRVIYTDNFAYTLIVDRCLELFIDIYLSQYIHVHIK